MRRKKLLIAVCVVILLGAISLIVSKITSNSNGSQATVQSVSSQERDTSAIKVSNNYHVSFDAINGNNMTVTGSLTNSSSQKLSVLLTVTIKDASTGSRLGQFQITAENVKPSDTSPFAGTHTAFSDSRNVSLTIVPEATFAAD